MFISPVQSESAISIHINPPLESPSYSTPIPRLQIITEHWAELPVLYSSFPLAVHFTCGSVYMLMLLCQFVPPPLSPAVSTCPFSMYASYKKNLCSLTYHNALCLLWWYTLVLVTCFSIAVHSPLRENHLGSVHSHHLFEHLRYNLQPNPLSKYLWK